MAASLLAKAVVQRAKRLNVPPSSRASPLPQGICGATKSIVNTEHCGSELARESGGSAGKDFGCTAVFAGKPAPTGFLWHHQIIGQHGTLWERACSRKRWISRQRFWMYRRLRGQARSHRVFVASPNHWSTRNIVGASLLAKALAQANMMLNVPPPSRAGSHRESRCR